MKSNNDYINEMRKHSIQCLKRYDNTNDEVRLEKHYYYEDKILQYILKKQCDWKE